MNGKTFILLLLSALAPCWGQQPLDAAAIVTLHAAGVSTAELDRLVTAHGIAKLDPTGIETLRKAGVGSALIARLEADLRAASPDPLDIEAIVALVDAGVKADQIIDRIRTTNSTFDLKIDHIVDLAKRGVPGEVIKEMRSRGTTVGKITAAATTVTVEDVIDMSKAKMPSAEILRRIAKADARFKLVVDDLLDLSRKGVGHDVLKELWSRRESAVSSQPNAEDVAAKPDTADQPEGKDEAADPVAADPESDASESPSLTTHREPSGGFSLNVPSAFAVYREGRNANSLVSFTDQVATSNEGLPTAEMQVLRYRSRKPEWLVERNLENIAQRFLTMLKSGYIKKGLSLAYSDPAPTHISGNPARAYKVSSSARDGTSHEGRVFVTWQDDQVFVLSYAVRSDLVTSTGQTLDDCVRSFTFEARREVAVSDGQDRVTFLFETWRKAVTSRDFALYRELFPAGFDTTANRHAFVELTNRLGDPNLRLTIGKVSKHLIGAAVECQIIGPTSTESLQLAFSKDGERLLLQGS